MTPKLARRQALRLAVIGGLGSLAAACSPQPTASSAPTLTIASTSVPPTRLPAASATPPPSSATPGAGLAAPNPLSTATAIVTPEPTPITLTTDIARAASQFLEALNAPQRAKATYAFADTERVRWHWTTPGNFPRHGLPLRELEVGQRDLALALLQGSVSEAGFQKALNIMSLQNDLGNDPELYYVTVFGAPGGAEPWGWRFEGHHLSRQFTVVGDQIAVTPFFLGAWPTVSGAGLKAMEREEWAARELMTSLAGTQFTTALLQERTLTRHVTQNEPYVVPLEQAGLLFGEMLADQQALVLEIMQTYLGTLPDHLSQAHFERAEIAGLENIRFGWAGPLESLRPHYYRLQGPTFLLEHDNSRGGGTHIHSVWRDFTEDFGQHLM